jgi:hypothetical protein
MRKRLKTYQLAAIFGAVAITALAPSLSTATVVQCRQVLQSYTPEQVDLAIADFAELTRKVDLSLLNGDKDLVSRSQFEIMQIKEKELLSTLKISRKELLQIVREKNLALYKNEQKKQNAKNAATEKAKLFPEINLDPLTPFSLESTVKASPSGYDTQVSSNGKRMAVTRSWTVDIFDLTTGKRKEIGTQKNILLNDRVLSYSDKDSNISIFNLNTGKTNTVPLAVMKPSFRKATNNNNVLAYNFTDTAFHYSLINRDGKVIYLESTSLRVVLNKPEVIYVGDKYWLIRSGEQVYRYKPSDLSNKMAPLIESTDRIIEIPDSNYVFFIGEKDYSLVNLDTGFSLSEVVETQFWIPYANRNFFYLKTDTQNASEIQKVSISNLQRIGKPIPVPNVTNITAIPESNLLSIQTITSPENPMQSGVYHNTNLSKNLYPTIEPNYSYSNGRHVSQQFFTPKAKKLVIVYSDDTGGLQHYVDVRTRQEKK